MTLIPSLLNQIQKILERIKTLLKLRQNNQITSEQEIYLCKMVSDCWPRIARDLEALKEAEERSDYLLKMAALADCMGDQYWRFLIRGAGDQFEPGGIWWENRNNPDQMISNEN
ncbi:hypothetical protein [Puia dinghuensis]|uniref:hypothetical protein n=1 Tax=Puia dinghuensis TaxID=1792502 RepID=UPI00166C5514|nr:hypothetical protein [Puia dinghuensis]